MVQLHYCDWIIREAVKYQPCAVLRFCDQAVINCDATEDRVEADFRFAVPDISRPIDVASRLQPLQLSDNSSGIHLQLRSELIGMQVDNAPLCAGRKPTGDVGQHEEVSIR